MESNFSWEQSCWILHLDGVILDVLMNWGTRGWNASPEEGDVGVLLDGELNMNSIFKKQKQENIHLNLMQKTLIWNI